MGKDEKEEEGREMIRCKKICWLEGSSKSKSFVITKHTTAPMTRRHAVRTGNPRL